MVPALAMWLTTPRFVNRALPRSLLLATLLVASYVFYGFSGPGFVLLLEAL